MNGFGRTHRKKTYRKTQGIVELGIFFDRKSLLSLDILEKKIYIALYLLGKEHIFRSLQCHFSLFTLMSYQVKKNLI